MYKCSIVNGKTQSAASRHRNLNQINRLARHRTGPAVWTSAERALLSRATSVATATFTPGGTAVRYNHAKGSKSRRTKIIWSQESQDSRKSKKIKTFQERRSPRVARTENNTVQNEKLNRVLSPSSAQALRVNVP